MVINELNDEAQWALILSESTINNKSAIVFKHSDTCSISNMALGRLQRNWKFKDEDVPFYLLEVKKFRSVSNLIAADLQIQHESPQIFIIKNGKCVYDASHSEINFSELETRVN